MKNLILYILIFLALFLKLKADDVYRFTTMGKEKNTTVVLPDGSNYNTFYSEGAFTDSDGNYGDITGRGVRETDSKGDIKNLSALLVFETKNNGKFYAKANRIESQIEAGAGFFDVLFANGNFEKLIGKRCRYGVTLTDKAFVMEGICK
tara:strand:- start:64 stop:510 length:447 start_codon:yes stop_codon:yes gene_type:complete